jgi:hypothetical protein
MFKIDPNPPSRPQNIRCKLSSRLQNNNWLNLLRNKCLYLIRNTSLNLIRKKVALHLDGAVDQIALFSSLRAVHDTSGAYE